MNLCENENLQEVNCKNSEQYLEIYPDHTKRAVGWPETDQALPGTKRFSDRFTKTFTNTDKLREESKFWNVHFGEGFKGLKIGVEVLNKQFSPPTNSVKPRHLQWFCLQSEVRVLEGSCCPIPGYATSPLFLRKEFPGNYLVLRSIVVNLNKQLGGAAQITPEKEMSHLGEQVFFTCWWRWHAADQASQDYEERRSHCNPSVQVLSSEETCTDSAQLALSEPCVLLCRYASATCQWEKQTGRPPPAHQACWGHWNQLLSQEIEEVTRGSQASTSDFKKGGTGGKFRRGR